MLIPAIDLRNGKVVQLVQGERLAIERDDLDVWIDKFRLFPQVQVIDLDAAMNAGSNAALVERICRVLPCRVGGGIRTPDRAREVLALGAKAANVGSALFRNSGVHLDAAAQFAAAIGAERLIAAVDSRAGRIVVDGWKTSIPVKTFDAIAALEPFCDEFLYTHVDTEGLLRGIDMDAVRAVRAATRKRLTVAGGIRSREDVADLDRLGVDAVVGMAIYTGALIIDEPSAGGSRPSGR
jgi:phosphoribosylformimino-5-aminoimidazole carboxamide ribotide isomerase